MNDPVRDEIDKEIQSMDADLKFYGWCLIIAGALGVALLSLF